MDPLWLYLKGPTFKGMVKGRAKEEKGGKAKEGVGEKDIEFLPPPTLMTVVCHMQVLHTSGLAEPSLLALSSGPARLIFRLYEHPSVTTRVRHFNYLMSSSSSAAVLAGLPDIHAVVDRIAAIGLFVFFLLFTGRIEVH